MRRPDWRTRLVSYLAQAARQPFRPGLHDCALFAAGAVEAITGADYAAPYRGRYSTERGGIRILRRDGSRDHIALAAAHLRQRAPGERAQPGDLAVIPTDRGPALGVVQGPMVYALGPAGMGLTPLDAAAMVYEV